MDSIKCSHRALIRPPLSWRVQALLLLRQPLVLEPLPLHFLYRLLLPRKLQKLAHILLDQREQIQQAFIPELELLLHEQVLLQNFGPYVVLEEHDPGVDQALQQVDRQLLISADL